MTEMKCEIEFQDYRFLTLRDASEVEHHAAGAAFQKLLSLAAKPDALRVTIGGKLQQISGSMLVWGVVTH